MIELLVFYAHIVAVATMFTKRWQEEGLVEGLLVVLFMALIFFVGWSITSFLMKLLMDQQVIWGVLDKDGAALGLLTVAECVLYYFYLKDDTSAEKERRRMFSEAEN